MLEKAKKQVEDSYYWDARVKELNCNYFGDEVTLVFGDNQDEITYHFKGCYNVKIEHTMEYPKDSPSRELALTQIPYFMQDVELNEIVSNTKKYMEFKINMYPIGLYVVCKKFDVYSNRL